MNKRKTYIVYYKILILYNEIWNHKLLLVINSCNILFTIRHAMDVILTSDTFQYWVYYALFSDKHSIFDDFYF